MQSLFDLSENKEIIDRINKLTPDMQGQWGKMNIAQAMAHCQVPLKVAYGELKLKRGLLAMLFGGIAKRSLLKEEPFKKHLPTDPNFIVRDDRNFEEEKSKLIPMVKRFAEQGSEILTKEAHPFFGRLTAEEWDILQWKHLDHHLRQFGV